MSQPGEPQLTEFGTRYVESVDMFILNNRADTALRVKLLVELNSLPQIAVELKKRVNSCTPFLRLPKELIREVAIALSNIWRPLSHHCTLGFSRGQATLGWITLSHVCHMARAILLEHHALWAQHSYFLPKAFSELIHRSGNVPLTLSFPDRNCSHTADCIQSMIKCIPRAQSILAEAWPYSSSPIDMWPMDPAWFSGQQLPLLEKMCLEFDRHTAQLDSITEDIYDLPPMQSPRLRQLTLLCYYIPFDPITLVDLSLMNHNSEIVLPSSAQFLDILRRCSTLQNLRLHSWIPQSLTPTASPTISLPSLVDIDIDDSSDRFLALWSHLTLPSAATRRVTIFSLESDLFPEVQYDALREALIQNFNNAIDGLTVDRYGEVGVRLIIVQHLKDDGRSASDLQPKSKLFDDHFKVALEMMYYSESLRLQHAAQFISQFIDCVHLQYLSFTNTSPYDASWMFVVNEWEVILNPFTGTHTLHEDNGIRQCHSLCKALTCDSSKPLLLPSLRCLWIGRLHLTETFRRSDFLEFVMSRRREKKGLERLRIDEISGIVEDEARNVLLPRLRALISRVECKLDESIIDEGWHCQEAIES